MRSSLLLRRFHACWLLAIFTATQLLPFSGTLRAAETHTAFLKQNLLATLGPLNLARLRIPVRMGRIETFRILDPARTVILIQDAHAVADAQNSIRAIAGYLTKQYGLRLFSLEGTPAKLDPFLLRNYPNAVKLKEIIQKHVATGELSGAAAAAILGSREADYYGIEDQKLYEEAIDFFLAALEQSAVWQKRLEMAGQELHEIIKNRYSPELLLWVEKTHQLDSSNRLKEGLEFIDKKYGTNINGYDFPHLAAFMKELTAGQRGRSSEKELLELAAALEKKIIRPKAVVKLHQKIQDFRTEKISPAALAGYLVQRARKAGISVPSGIRETAKYNDFLQNTHGEIFFEELQRFVDGITAALCRNEEERFLDAMDHRVDLLKKLIGLKLSRKEWEKLSGLDRRGFLLPRDESRERIGGLGKKIADLQEILLDPQTAFFLFYQNAVKREKALHTNLLKLMETTRNARAVFVAGGFHTRGMINQLEKEKISYVLITPAIAKTGGLKKYSDYMRGQVSWKSYFQAKNGRVDLYQAFVRAIRDELIQDLPADEMKEILKLWHDTVIRRLADQKQLSRAGDYTRLIDEAKVLKQTPVNLEMRQRQWTNKVRQFISDLQRLKKENHLTALNLYRLLGQTPQPEITAAVPVWNSIPAGFALSTWLHGEPLRRIPVFSASRSHPSLNSEMRTLRTNQLSVETTPLQRLAEINRRPLRVGFIAAHAGGQDGTSVEMEKWIRVLKEAGHSVLALIAGGAIGQKDVPTTLLSDEATPIHEVNHAILSNILPRLANRRAVNKNDGSPPVVSLTPKDILELIETSSEVVQEEIQKWLKKEKIDVLILEDTNTVPDNIVLGVAVSKALSKLKQPVAVISHDHRAGYFQSADFQMLRPEIAGYLRENLQLLTPEIMHVLTSENKEQEWLQELKQMKTKPVPISVIHNVENFADEPGGDGYAADFFEQIPGLNAGDVLIVHPERLIERKGLEYSLQLIKNINNPKIKLVVMNDHFTDMAYRGSIDEYIQELDIQDRVVFLKDQFGTKRGTTAGGKKIYTPDDVFSNASMISFPSYEESFGAILMKAVRARLPIILYPYPAYHDIKKRDIGTLKYPSYSGPRMTASSVKVAFASDDYQQRMAKIAKDVENLLESGERKKAMTQQNYESGKRYFSFDTLNRKLRNTIETAIHLRMSAGDPTVVLFDTVPQNERLAKLAVLNTTIASPDPNTDPKTTIALRVIRRVKYATLVRDAFYGFRQDLRNELPGFVMLMKKIAALLNLEGELRKKDFATIPVLNEADKQGAWSQIAADNEIILSLQGLLKEQADYKKQQERGETYVQTHAELEPLKTGNVIYFSAELAFKTIKNYSGGLGILSGDHVRGASDLGLNFIGFGLFYEKGYFTQMIDPQGRQKNIGEEPSINVAELPLQEAGPDDRQVFVNVPFPGRTVRAKVWKVIYGRATLYLLDANLEGNSPQDRQLTAHLYRAKDRTPERLEQYKLLGSGGMLALKELKELGVIDGKKPETFHFNDGHPMFAAIEAVANLMPEIPEVLTRSDLLPPEQMRFEIALQKVISKSVFTTHTPVAAGNEVYENMGSVRNFLNTIFPHNAYAVERFLSMGSMNGGFNLTVFLLRMSQFHNAVSELHSQVAQRMWKELYPGMDPKEAIIDIVNSVHDEYWQAPEIREVFGKIFNDPALQKLMKENRDLLRKKLQDDTWVDQTLKPQGAALENFNEQFWHTHQILKQKLYDEIIRREKIRQERGDATPEDVRVLEQLKAEAPDAFTIGFGRRFAPYKRGALILEDEGHLEALVREAQKQAQGKPIHLLFAGKAHPEDNQGKEIIARITDAAKRFQAKGSPIKIIFIENYNVELARYLEAGVDLWLNNPIRPREASGTSGMKASMNGVPNLSSKDGWVVEGIFGKVAGTTVRYVNGFLFGVESDMRDDFSDSELLYRGLAEILDLFHNHRNIWIRMMKTAIVSMTYEFGMERMLAKYAREMYAPAVRNDRDLSFEQARKMVEERLVKRTHVWNASRDGLKSKAEFDAYPTDGALGRETLVSVVVDFKEANLEDFGVDGFLESAGHDSGDEKKPRRWGELKAVSHVEANRYRYTFAVIPQEIGKHSFTVHIAPKNQISWSLTGEGEERDRVTIWSGAPAPIFIHDDEVLKFRASSEKDKGMLFFIRIPEYVKAENVYWASEANHWLSGAAAVLNPYALVKAPGTAGLWAIVVTEADAKAGIDGYEFEFLVKLPGGRERRTSGHYPLNSKTGHASISIHENSPLYNQAQARKLHQKISQGAPETLPEEPAPKPVEDDQILLKSSFIHDADARDLLAIQPSEVGFYWHAGSGQQGDQSNPGFLGFIETYEKKKKDAGFDAVLKYHTVTNASGAKPAGDLFNYLLAGVLTENRLTLFPLQKRIKTLAEKTAASKNDDEKIQYARQALEEASLLARELAWKVFVGYGKGNAEMLALFRNDIQGELLRSNLARLFEKYSVNLKSNGWRKKVVVRIDTTDNVALMPAYMLPLSLFNPAAKPEERAYVVINQGKKRVTKSANIGEAPVRVPGPGTKILLGPMLKQSQKEVQIYSVSAENAAGSLIQGPLASQPIAALKGGSHLNLSVPGPEDIAIFRFDLTVPSLMAKYLQAAIKGQSFWDEAPEVLIRREIEAHLEEGKAGPRLTAFLEKMIEPGLHALQNRFDEQDLTVLMGFVAFLAPGLLERMKNWNPIAYQKLSKFLDDPKNQALFRDGKIAFHGTSSTRAMEISRTLDGRRIFFPIHFAKNKEQDLDPDRKIEVVLTMGREKNTPSEILPLFAAALKESKGLQVRNVLGMRYSRVHTEKTLMAEGRDLTGAALGGWHQRVPAEWRWQILEWVEAEVKVGNQKYEQMTLAVNLGDLSIEITDAAGKAQMVMVDGIGKLKKILHFLAGKGFGKIYLYGGLYTMSKYSVKTHTVGDTKQNPLQAQKGRVIGKSVNYRTKLVSVTLPDGRPLKIIDNQGNPFSYVLDEEGLPELNPKIFRENETEMPSAEEKEQRIITLISEMHDLGIEVILDFIPVLSPEAIDEKNYKWTFYRELDEKQTEKWEELTQLTGEEALIEQALWMSKLANDKDNEGLVAVRITEGGRERVILVRHYYRGRNADQIALNPFHPEVRNFYFRQLKRLIHWGVDGVRVDLPGEFFNNSPDMSFYFHPDSKFQIPPEAQFRDGDEMWADLLYRVRQYARQKYDAEGKKDKEFQWYFEAYGRWGRQRLKDLMIEAYVRDKDAADLKDREEETAKAVKAAFFYFREVFQEHFHFEKRNSHNVQKVELELYYAFDALEALRSGDLKRAMQLVVMASNFDEMRMSANGIGGSRLAMLAKIFAMADLGVPTYIELSDLIDVDPLFSIPGGALTGEGKPRIDRDKEAESAHTVETNPAKIAARSTFEGYRAMIEAGSGFELLDRFSEGIREQGQDDVQFNVSWNHAINTSHRDTVSMLSIKQPELEVWTVVATDHRLDDGGDHLYHDQWIEFPPGTNPARHRVYEYYRDPEGAIKLREIQPRGKELPLRFGPGPANSAKILLIDAEPRHAIVSRSELRRAIAPVILALTGKNPLQSADAKKFVSLSNTEDGFFTTLEAEALQPVHAAAWASHVQDTAVFYQTHTDYEAALTQAVKLLAQNTRQTAGIFLSKHPAAHLNYAFALSLESADRKTSTQIQRYLEDYLQQIRGIRKFTRQYPGTKVKGNIRILISRAQSMDPAFKSFARIVGRSGMAKLLVTDDPKAVEKLEFFLAQNPNALVYGLAGSTLKLKDAALLNRVVASRVDLHAQLPVTLILTGHLAQEGFHLTPAEIEQIEEHHGAVIWNGRRFEITEDARTLVYQNYQMQAYTAAMA